jgi:hypothetical protein
MKEALSPALIGFSFSTSVGWSVHYTKDGCLLSTPPDFRFLIARSRGGANWPGRVFEVDNPKSKI